MKKDVLIEKIEELIEPIISELLYELYYIKIKINPKKLRFDC